MAPVSGLPAIAAAALPADVRRAPKADQDAYKAALGFERLLVAQLVESAMPGREDDGPYAGAVTDGFADALMQGGGLGLARQIHAGLGRRA
jgi:hypothetical protein